MGLLENLKNLDKGTYSSVSKDGLTKLIEEAFKLKKQEGISITLYTGLYSMYVFNLCMMGFGTPLVYYTFGVKHKKNTHLIVLNLFKKSGLIKAVINTSTRLVEIREGTKVIKTAFTFDEIGKYLSDITPKEQQYFYTPKGNKRFIK